MKIWDFVPTMRLLSFTITNLQAHSVVGVKPFTGVVEHLTLMYWLLRIHRIRLPDPRQSVSQSNKYKLVLHDALILSLSNIT